jgi:flavin reductase (DIM6/NTAB) family NADH-FMN oxidoreductase RutF
VTIVAVRSGGRVVATTVSAFLSLSLDPPLVLVAIGPNATVRPFLQPGTELGISVLAADQKRLATVFADAFPVGPDPFPAEGAPLIPGSLLRIVCDVARVDPGDGHAVITAAVRDIARDRGSDPLIRYDRKYRALAD